MTKPPPRTLTVVDKQPISPNMQSIVLGGEALNDFPTGFEGGYIKLNLSEVAKSNNELVYERVQALNAKKPVMRSYTIRQFDPAAGKLTLNFMNHGDGGPACAWSSHCTIGDNITIGGPGAVKRVDNDADWFFIAGDMTALPAISVNLEQLPKEAKGYAVLEIIDEQDKQTIKRPTGIEVHWVINPHPERSNTLLADTVKNLPWLEGRPNIWVASEFETMRNLRRYFKQERLVDREDIYISSYWKMGTTDEGNKIAKKSDPEANI